MATKHIEYLAVNVLNEQNIVSYRSLSRALKVHSNAAKEMLYEFHRQQNARKPGSVHATYLISGLRRLLSEEIGGSFVVDNGDEVESSAYMSSSQAKEDSQKEDAGMLKSIILAKEGDLEAAKARYETITSIHIYTLETGPITDLQVLSSCNRDVASKYANEDPLEAWKQYGTIHNPNAKRRPRRGPAPPATSIVAVDEAKPALLTQSSAMTNGNGVKAKQADTQIHSSKPEKSPNIPDKTESPAIEPAMQSKRVLVKPPTLRRDASSFFKNAKPKREHTGSSAASSIPSRRQSTERTAAEDEPMKDMSEDEQDDETSLAPRKTEEGEATESRKDREERLRQMMEIEEDEEMTEPHPAEADESQDLEPPPPAQPEKEPTPEQTVTVTDGRRRGRRRVIKKKTIKDEEGYLVTKEEAAWESFSEDEPQAKKIKPLPSMPPLSRGRKSTGKAGQGNIASFFTKK